MPDKSVPDLSLFLDILQKLEAIGVPYVIIGGFAATIYGITRATYDIDIIVDLDEEHIQALADAYPLPRYRPALENRVRQVVELPGMAPFAVWAARPEDVIVGKLMAWAELSTKRHESDIYEMMVFHYLGLQPDLKPPFDEDYIDTKALRLGKEVAALWQDLKTAARQEANRAAAIYRHRNAWPASRRDGQKMS